MAAKFLLKMYDAEDNCIVEEVCFYFRYTKEIYTPYVYFEGKYLSSANEISQINRIEFWIYKIMFHSGIVDSIDICRKDNRNVIHVKSKSFTSLLCQNQPEPGMLKDVDLAKLISTYSDIPYITCEDSAVENYINIKDGATVWDAICNLGFRQTGFYPYIEGANKVKITPKKFYRWNYYENKDVLAAGVNHDFTRIISHIHMQDVSGEYNVYNKANAEAVSRNIIRHKQIPLDRQFLYNPESALDYKLNYGMRGNVFYYIKYMGYNYEDLFDLFSYGNFSGKKVHKVDVVFNSGKLVTLLESYDDGFFSST